MPGVNWYGWFVTSVLVALAFEMLGGMKAAPDALTERGAEPVFALNVLFPISICLLYGLPLAGVIGAIVLAISLVAVRWRWRTAETHREPALTA